MAQVWEIGRAGQDGVVAVIAVAVAGAVKGTVSVVLVQRCIAIITVVGASAPAIKVSVVQVQAGVAIVTVASAGGVAVVVRILAGESLPTGLSIPRLLLGMFPEYKIQ